MTLHSGAQHGGQESRAIHIFPSHAREVLEPLVLVTYTSEKNKQQNFDFIIQNVTTLFVLYFILGLTLDTVETGVTKTQTLITQTLDPSKTLTSGCLKNSDH